MLVNHIKGLTKDINQHIIVIYQLERRKQMHNLVYLNNNEAVCSSLQVAEKFNKRHANVIRVIEKIISDSPTQNCVRCFKKTSYKDGQGKPRPMYEMNRDGFTFLVMGFTGKEANKWKWDYINAFNKMETILRERTTEVWLQTRQQGKLTRKSETDVIKRLVELAKEQGSEHSDKLYMTYSKLANKMAGIKKRDEATVSQLNNLSLMENIILNCIQHGIVQEKHYKDIYQDCKRRLEMFKDIAYLEVAS